VTRSDGLSSSSELASAMTGTPEGYQSDELLRADRLNKRFPGVQALQAVSISLHRGTVHALVGQNGAGKSTLVKCISGVYVPESGHIYLEGREVRLLSPRTAFSLGITTVHQRPQLLPSLSVAENIMLGQLPVRKGRVFIDRRQINEDSRALLARLAVSIDPEEPVSRLGAAERQQVAIAKAIYRNAKLLILDEPTVCLDAGRIEQLFRLIEELRRYGMAILYVSHHLEEIFRIADQVTVLRDGRLVATASTAELTPGHVITLMAGDRGAVQSRNGKRSSSSSTQPAIELHNVSTKALHGIDLMVRTGEVVGVTGLIGAGGHSLAQVLFGLEQPQSGEVLLGGRPFRPRGPKQAIARGVFVVPEDTARSTLVPLLSLAANVTLADLAAVSHRGFLSLARERELARHFVSELAIASPSVTSPVRTLSGGNQQKVSLAKALNAKANVLILEEPTQGVDVRAKSEIHNIIRDLAGQDKAVIVISTDIRDLLEFVDRLVALRNGKIVADFSAGETSYTQVLDVTIGAQGVTVR